MPSRSTLIHAAVLLAIGLAWFAATLGWALAGDGWLHGDGAIHLARTREFARWLAGEASIRELVPLWGYGPLAYLLGAPFLLVLGDSWTAAVAGAATGGLAGLAGAWLLGRRLGGSPWTGHLSALALAALPGWRLHTVNLDIDPLAGGWTALALAALAAARGTTRRLPWALAGVATALALGTRWTVGATLLLAYAWAAWPAQRVGRGRVEALLRILLGVAVLLGAAETYRRVAVPVDSLVLPLLTGAVSAALAVRLLRRPTPVGAPLGSLAIAAAIVVPVFWVGQFGVLTQLDTVVTMGTDPDSYELPAAARTAGAQAGYLLAALRNWHLGPVWTPSLALGLAGFLLVRRTRSLVLTLAAIVATGWLVAVLGKGTWDERHVLPYVALLVPVAAAWPGLLPALPGVPLGAVPAGISLLSLLGWLLPGAPGAVDPAPWRRNVPMPLEPDHGRIHPGWTDPAQRPWMGFTPYRAGMPKRLARALREALGPGQHCVAWIIDPTVRGDPRFDLLDALPQTETEARAQGDDPLLEDILDRPEARVEDYDAWVLVEPAGGELAERLANHLAPEPLERRPFPFDGLVATLVWRASGPLPGDCRDRMRGGLLLLGEGFRRGAVLLPRPLREPDPGRRPR